MKSAFRPSPRFAALLITFFFVLNAGLNVATARGKPAGRPTVAVVLGGGSARGISHIGLLKAFAEEGIPVDMLVGTSIGSVVAGLHASGLSIANLEYLVTHLDLGRLFSTAAPGRGGIVETSRFERFLDALIGGATFDDVVLPYYSVVTHLQTGAEVVLHEGSVTKAILASIAIPGVFPPVEIDGEYYVDGGVASLIPVSAARRFGADVVIAVDVRRVVEPVDPHDVIAVLDLMMDHLLGANVKQQLELADIVINPGLDSDSYMEYDQAELFIAKGYEAAKAAIPQIRELLLQRDPQFPFGSQEPPAGLSPEEMEARLALALAEAEREGRWLKMAPPVGMELRRDHPPIVRAGFDLPVGKLADGRPIYGSLSRERGAAGWVSTLGIGTGNCRVLCGGVFGRLDDESHRFNPGVLLQGEPNKNLRYRLEWEYRPEKPSAWSFTAHNPASPSPWGQRHEVRLQVLQDPRGLTGPAHEELKADVLYRFYFPGPTANMLGLVRGNLAWYVGAGMRISFARPARLDALGEAGVLVEGRLFGLVPMRSRLSVVYSGEDAPWSLRWTMGE